MKKGNVQTFKFRWAFFPNLGVEQDNFDVKACLPKIHNLIFSFSRFEEFTINHSIDFKTSESLFW